MTIDTLPDDVLLLIFYFHRVTSLDGLEGSNRLGLSWRWDRLVHVCWRWRTVVFASPKFLDVKNAGGSSSRMELLGIWPPLPIFINNLHRYLDAAVVHRNRVCELSLVNLKSSQLRQLASAMQVQYPALIHLRLGFSRHGPAPTLPDRFLGGSAPLLQSLTLEYIPFPALPNLLLSATNLVHLTLEGSPDSAYISPEVIVTCLAVLANLKSLAIGFAFPQSHPDQESRPPPPPTCTVLHALTYFKFTGVSEYLEDLVARIDVPLLDSIRVGLFDRPTFDFPQLTRLMRRATRFQAPYEVHVDFDFFGIQMTSLPPRPGFDEELRLDFLWRTLERELSPLVHVFASFLPSIHMVDHLYIDWARPSISPGRISIAQGYMEWLEIFRPFTAVKNFYISKELAHCIALFLKGLVKERVTDVLPALESLFLEELYPSGPIQEAIGSFVAARQLLGHPVAVSLCNFKGSQEHQYE